MPLTETTRKYQKAQIHSLKLSGAKSGNFLEGRVFPKKCENKFISKECTIFKIRNASSFQVFGRKNNHRLIRTPKLQKKSTNSKSSKLLFYTPKAGRKVFTALTNNHSKSGRVKSVDYKESLLPSMTKKSEMGSKISSMNKINLHYLLSKPDKPKRQIKSLRSTLSGMSSILSSKENSPRITLPLRICKKRDIGLSKFFSKHQPLKSLKKKPRRNNFPGAPKLAEHLGKLLKRSKSLRGICKFRKKNNERNESQKNNLEHRRMVSYGLSKIRL